MQNRENVQKSSNAVNTNKLGTHILWDELIVEKRKSQVSWFHSLCDFRQSYRRPPDRHYNCIVNAYHCAIILTVFNFIAAFVARYAFFIDFNFTTFDENFLRKSDVKDIINFWWFLFDEKRNQEKSKKKLFS
jgi:hypothetical protein